MAWIRSLRDSMQELEGEGGQHDQEMTVGQKKRARKRQSTQLHAASTAQGAMKELTEKEKAFVQQGRKLAKVTKDMKVNMSRGLSVDRAFVDDDVRLAVGIHAAFPQDGDILKSTLLEFEATRDSQFFVLDTKDHSSPSLISLPHLQSPSLMSLTHLPPSSPSLISILHLPHSSPSLISLRITELQVQLLTLQMVYAAHQECRARISCSL